MDHHRAIYDIPWENLNILDNSIEQPNLYRS